MVAELLIPWLRWRRLVLELRRRGGGARETGAFLLTRRGENKVLHCFYYDDLDPRCLDHGNIEFDGKGYVSLWRFCSENEMRVTADVHTHPGPWVGQSPADMAHPMICQPGHMALIVPRYALGSSWTLRGVGVHRYLGGGKWRSDQERQVRLTLL